MAHHVPTASRLAAETSLGQGAALMIDTGPLIEKLLGTFATAVTK
jgi:hypothetical protein